MRHPETASWSTVGGGRDQPPRVAGLLPGIAGMMLVGSSVAVVGAVSGAAALWVQTARYAMATLCLLMILYAGGRRLPDVRRGDVLPVCVGVIIGTLTGMVGFNLALIIGNQHAEPDVSGSAVSCIPIALAVAGPVANRRKPQLRLVAGAVVVAAGAVLVSGWGRTDRVGIMMGLVLITGEAGFTLAGAAVMPRIGVWGYSIMTCGTAAVIFGLLAMVAGQPVSGLLMPAALLATGYLGVVVTSIAFVLWLSSVHRVGAAVAGLASGVVAPVSALVGVALGRPMPGPAAWGGMLVILVGLIIGLAGPLSYRS